MKKATAVMLALGAVALMTIGASATAGEAVPAGHQAFMDLKCNMCHSVPSAGIEAKTKSEKMKGPDLLAGNWTKELLVRYMKKEAEAPDGSEHKKEFKGSDEELQALVDWLLEQKAE